MRVTGSTAPGKLQRAKDSGDRQGDGQRLGADAPTDGVLGSRSVVPPPDIANKPTNRTITVEHRREDRNREQIHVAAPWTGAEKVRCWRRQRARPQRNGNSRNTKRNSILAWLHRIGPARLVERVRPPARPGAYRTRGKLRSLVQRREARAEALRDARGPLKRSSCRCRCICCSALPLCSVPLCSVPLCSLPLEVCCGCHAMQRSLCSAAPMRVDAWVTAAL